VTVEGRPLQGLALALVELQSGEIHRVKSDAQGGYKLSVQPGEYVLTTSSLAGLGVGKGPSRVSVEAGRVAVASLELIALPIAYTPQTPDPAQAPAPPPKGPQTHGNITYDPPACVVEGQFPLLEAQIQPAASIARARFYFKSELSPQFYYVEGSLAPGVTAARLPGTKVASAQISGAMLPQATPPLPGTFWFKLPKPKLEAKIITGYFFAITTDGNEGQSPEFQMQVVADESECEGKAAPIAPTGPVTVFTQGGAAAGALAGFGNPALLGATGIILAGLGIAALIGGAAAVAAGDDTTTTSLVITTTSTTSTTTSTIAPTTTSTTTTSTIPNCVYNTTNQPTNCPCLPTTIPPATTSAPTFPTGTCP
jgi:hypothetical protein